VQPDHGSVWSYQSKSTRKKTAICRSFASSRDFQQAFTLSLHGRGRWFDPSIAHSYKVSCCRQNASARKE
jgi:hypothetical protein